MLLVYTHKITPRITYIFKHVFENMLRIPLGFTSTIENFVAHAGPKMSYTTKPLGDEFSVASHPLLFEKGISDQNIVVEDWQGVPAFFKTAPLNLIPHDIFAASFFLLSRYEESLPHRKKAEGYFDPHHSLAYQHNFIEIPLVDHWVLNFYKVLCKIFPDLEGRNEASPKKEIVIDVPLAFRYRHRSLLVIFQTFLQSIWVFDILKIVDQIMVLLRLDADPYDSFLDWERWFGKSTIKPKVFFLYSNSSAFESNISILNKHLQERIKNTGDLFTLGLLPSIQAQLKPERYLKKEIKNFQALTHRQVQMSRIPQSMKSLSEVYSDLVDAEFTSDYSMGYPNEIGFRASTAVPFYFYDISNEFQLPLKIHPIVANEKTIIDGKENGVFKRLDEIFKNLPLTCSQLTIAIGNGFLHKRFYKDPLQNAFKEHYIK